jgi:hypothetical protein
LDVLEGRSLPSAFTVTNVGDSGGGTLRQAILNANANPGPDTIAFDSTFFSTPRTILLTSGQLTISDSLAITGPGAAGLTVSGNNAGRIFNITNGAGEFAVNLSGLTLTGGRTTGSDPGGAIDIQVRDGNVAISDCVIDGNTAAGSVGGAIAINADNGSLSMLRSTISNNSASGAGGAIAAEGLDWAGDLALLIRDSTLSGNTSGQGGGAIDFYTYAFSSSVAIQNSTFSGNTAATAGGAINFYAGLCGSLSVQNSTISGNRAGASGGGMMVSTYIVGPVFVQNSTVTGNTATSGSGGGIAAAPYTTPAITVLSSIVSGNVNAHAPDIFGFGTFPVDVNFSAIGSAAGFALSARSGNNLPYGANLNLGPLADNGGPTMTHALLPGSPAIDAGPPSAAGDCDQRGPGFARVVCGRIDIGAYEAPAGGPYTFTVSTLADSGPGSLRQAILDANSPAYPYADRITFAVSGTINLAGALPDLSTNIDVSGPGTGVLVVRRSTGGNYRIFTVTSGASVALSGLTLANGYVGYSDRGGGVLNEGTLSVSSSTISGSTAYTGGGIFNLGTLTLSNSTLASNSAPYGGGIENRGSTSVTNSTISGNTGGSGGGIDNYGTMTVANSTVSANSAGAWGGGGIENGGALEVTNSTLSGNSGWWGGGVYNLVSGTMTMTTSTVSGNSAGDMGGGICNEGTLSVTDSTLSVNSAPNGGGMETGSGRAGSTLTLTNSTVSGNSATVSGGGILNVGAMTVTNSTISGNSAPSGGGVYSHYYRPGFPGLTTLADCIIGGNTLPDGVTPSDLDGDSAIIGSSHHNLIGPGGSGGLVNGVNGNIVVQTIADLRLGGLADNGGPTKTLALLPGSPAINAGDSAATRDFDQRGPGYTRVVGGRIDIGAFEVQTVPGPWVAGTQINGGAAQRSRVTDIKVTFNQLVTFAGSPSAAFRVTRDGPGGQTGDVTLAVDLSASTATQTIARLSFSGGLTEFGSLIDGNYSLTVISSQVSAGGVALDGDLDGTPGGDLTMTFFRLYGDVNGDRAVNGLDLAAFRSTFGTVSSDATFVSALDFNGDGAINGADLTQFRNRFGVSLP